ncbi:7266_t:CDS:1, partial [Dentiscutata erythropus]
LLPARKNIITNEVIMEEITVSSLDPSHFFIPSIRSPETVVI